MTMKTALIFALGIASTAAILSAHAQTYQWKDSSGQTIISDTPPPASVKAARAIGSAQPTVVKGDVVAEKPADGAKSTAEKDLEFKKRQQEAREKADKDAKEQKAAADKRENCTRARQNLAALESNQPMVSPDEKGQPQLMNSSQRDQELARAREFVNQHCQ